MREEAGREAREWGEGISVEKAQAPEARKERRRWEWVLMLLRACDGEGETGPHNDAVVLARVPLFTEAEAACARGREVVLTGEAGGGQRGLFGVAMRLGNSADLSPFPLVSSFSTCLHPSDARVLCDHVRETGGGVGAGIVISAS